MALIHAPSRTCSFIRTLNAISFGFPLHELEAVQVKDPNNGALEVTVALPDIVRLHSRTE